MRSLKYRLLISIVLIVGIIWLVVAPWFYFTIKSNVNEVLDDRLAASANMLAAVVQQYHLGNEGYGPTGHMLKDLSQSTAFPESIACRVSRLDGSLIASSGERDQSALASVEDGYSLVKGSGTVWRVFKLSRNDFTVTTAEKIDKRQQLLNLILIGVVVPLIFAAVVMLVIFTFAVNQVLKPLTHLQKQFSERNGSSLTPISLSRTPSEIKGVVAEFNSLLGRVQRVIDNERRFTADAAHELRTPLAGISTQLQVAMLKSDPKISDSLSKAQTALNQLSQMLDQLLMLARLESNQMSSVSSETSVTAITEKALSPLKSMLDSKQVEVLLGVGEDTRLHLPEELVSLALRNVLKNAIQFSGQGQKIEISVIKSHMIIWNVEDSAGGVADDMLPDITERFVHDKAKGNFGLGLSITKSITDVLEGQLLFENTSSGLRVTLKFPYRL